MQETRHHKNCLLAKLGSTLREKHFILRNNMKAFIYKNSQLLKSRILLLLLLLSRERKVRKRKRERFRRFLAIVSLIFWQPRLTARGLASASDHDVVVAKTHIYSAWKWKRNRKHIIITFRPNQVALLNMKKELLWHDVKMHLSLSLSLSLFFFLSSQVLLLHPPPLLSHDKWLIYSTNANFRLKEKSFYAAIL
jgi:hypothetical protein